MFVDWWPGICGTNEQLSSAQSEISARRRHPVGAHLCEVGCFRMDSHCQLDTLDISVNLLPNARLTFLTNLSCSSNNSVPASSLLYVIRGGTVVVWPRRTSVLQSLYLCCICCCSLDFIVRKPNISCTCACKQCKWTILGWIQTS